VVARELFRWRDDETETTETKRTGIGLLFWCSLNDNVEAVLELAKEAAANKNGRGRNESHNALRIHRPDLFGVFIKGLTALHVASFVASSPVVEALLEMGANPTAKLVNGMDSLMLMSMFGIADNITRWCERFPTWDFSRRDRTGGLTALSFAIMLGPNKLEAVKALVKAGANPLEFTALTGTTCLHNAAANKDAGAELVRYLLELSGVRALINKPMRARTYKWKATYLAARLLVKLGAKKAILLEVSEWSKNTALICAARNGNAAVIKVLVEEGGADIRPRNARGHSALDGLVCGANALEETRMLLEGGSGY
jgi:ankyrin repeat protein